MLNPVAFIFIIIFSLLFFGACYQVYRQDKRRARISTFPFPAHCLQKLKQHHPELSDAQIHEVELGLRQFFLAWHNSGFKFVSMPSQVVDDLWHELILCTREYAQFCDQAFGRFLHHHPSGTIQASDKTMNEGLRRCWWHACKIDNIDPAKPARLPGLFELDARLNIRDGFHYAIKPVLPAAASAPNVSTVSTRLDRASLLIASLALTMLPVAAFADKTIDGTLTGFGPKGESGCGGGCGGGGGDGGGGDGGCGGCGGCGGE